jgi:hypothetical protein
MGLVSSNQRFRNIHFKIVAIIFLLFCACNLRAQNMDSLFKDFAVQMQLNKNAPISADLYLHVDKQIYNPGENIWFAAYLLNPSVAETHHTLHFILINDMTRKLVKSQNFVLESGMGSGSFYIPDSLATGQYSLIAITNQFSLQKAPQFFRQAISIIGPEPLFKIQFSGTIKGDSLLFTANVKRKSAEKKDDIFISYSIFANGTNYSKSTKQLNALNELNFNMPKSMIKSSLEILGEIRQGKDKMDFKYPLYWASNLSYINFFPENGYLEDGHLTKVAFEIKSTIGKSLAENCLLFEDGKVISNFSSDQFGRGKFRFVPQKGRKYSIKLEGNPELPLQQFPDFRNNIWEIQSNNIVKDSLEIGILSPDINHECFVVVHNTREMLFGTKILLPKGNGKFRIPTREWPDGIARISLLDNNNQLKSEKVIYINQNQENLIATVLTDSLKYHRLSKVKVTIKLVDKENQPVKGIFSLGAVSKYVYGDHLIDLKRFTDYDRFFDGSSLPPWSYLLQVKNIENELFMLNDQMKGVDHKSNLKTPDLPPDRDGYVLYEEKKIKKPVNLLLMAEKADIISTDSTGDFKLPYESLRGASGGRLLLSVSGRSPLGYRLVIDPKQKEMDDTFARKYFRLYPFITDELTAAQKSNLYTQNVTMLNEIKINAMAKRSKEYFGKSDSSGICNDYVCYLGFLNCQSHGRGTPGTTIAQDGQKYRIDGLSGTEEIIYHCTFKGLAPYMKSIPFTAMPSAFPVFDIANNNVAESYDLTTLHWQNNIITNEKGEAEVYFYTNKRTGDFIINIQGISPNGVFSKQVEFKVLE